MRRRWIFIWCVASVYGLAAGSAELGGGPSLVISPLHGVFQGAQEVLRWPRGESLNLTCWVMSSEVEDYTFEWYPPKPSENVHLLWDDEFSGRGRYHRLIISDAQPEDSGTYKCTASSGLLTLHAQLRVLVTERLGGEVESPCKEGFFRCGHLPALHFSRICLAPHYICDGISDCPDGADESAEECGYGDPCATKLRCANRRCLDPSVCCDPHTQDNCTYLRSCCAAFVHSNRFYFSMGLDQGRHRGDMELLHTTLYTILGCVAAFLIILLIVSVVLCRLQLAKHGRRPPLEGWWYAATFASLCPGHHSPRRERPHPPLTLDDVDLYVNSLRQVDDPIADGFIQQPPPPYLASTRCDPPPPYRENEWPQQQIIVLAESVGVQEPLLINNNNNGDINGNSDDQVDHNQGRQGGPS